MKHWHYIVLGMLVAGVLWTAFRLGIKYLPI